jgi:hypothetical protein
MPRSGLRFDSYWLGSDELRTLQGVFSSTEGAQMPTEAVRVLSGGA